ncbi:hypothetical protein ACIHCM_00115 [Streptomyces sp. NPDC052023]|uniref:hypothetical protein n=1 Tax=Streptomyces sp. NPDC052023 TaxID=3365681 RepID=UPI0037D1FEB4
MGRRIDRWDRRSDYRGQHARDHHPAHERRPKLLDRSERVTLLVGEGARAAREDVLTLADRLAAPMVLTLKAKAA